MEEPKKHKGGWWKQHGNAAYEAMNLFSPEKVRRLSKHFVAWGLREQRLSFPEIAEHMGIPVSEARRLVKSVFEMFQGELKESVEEHVASATAKFDKMELMLSPAIAAGDIKAIDAARKINMARLRVVGALENKVTITHKRAVPDVIEVGRAEEPLEKAIDRALKEAEADVA